ncbi:MAG: hypothetical protein A2289_07140 [Deltaproteobacteria bacterium RIFOXYA12_FULL_58_15]|nr:MAG: hypothetical protein A2289_07140 [Deltaproteobacteria bacterium RIFOXYA12_FULL_58_15]
MNQQLHLFDTPSPPPRPIDAWLTGPNAFTARAQESAYSDDEGYTHLIRDPGDPERLTREEAKRLGIRELAPHTKLDETPVSEWRRLIRAHLHDRGSSTGYPDADKVKAVRTEFTFNHIMVELADVTADIAFSTNADRALWSLVHQGVLEHTASSPVLFRPYESIVDVHASLDGDNMWRCHYCNRVVPQNRWTQGADDCPHCEPDKYELP